MAIRVLIQMRDLRVGNGIAACIMNYYEYTVKHGYQIDFLLNRNIDSPYAETVKKNGSNIYTLPFDTNKPNKENWSYIKKIIDRRYDILHVNLSGLNALEALKAAKECGVKIRIYHAHNPKETSSLKARIRSFVYEIPSVWLANRYAACSSYAGDSLFGKKTYLVIKNPIDTRSFIYDETARKRLRETLEIEDKFVVGVVGRLTEQKNPFFIIDIFEKIKKYVDNAYLIWAGEGNLKTAVEKYVKRKNLMSSVKLLGIRDDVNKLYSAMDVFLLPSKFEGFGIVFVEAQMSGLQCYGSDKVPIDVQVSDNMHRIPLNKSASEWCNEIIKNNGCVKSKRESLAGTGFEVEGLVESLVKLYKC